MKAEDDSVAGQRMARRATNLYQQLGMHQTPALTPASIESGGGYVQPRSMHPMAMTILSARQRMGAALIGLGVIEFLAHWFLPYNGTVLATQMPTGPDSVGRVRQTPESMTVTRMYPQLNIAIGSALAGVLMLATAAWPAARLVFMRECTEFLSYIIHLQACFQSMILIVTVLPLAGVVNVYELALAAMLTFAGYFIMLFSDMGNQKQFSHWETVDTWRIDMAEDPYVAFRRAASARHIEPLLVFNWLPVVMMLVVFCFIWIIIFMHLGDALNSSTYSVEGDFVAVVIGTGILQALIPIVKIVQLARPSLLVQRNLCSYKFVVATIDVVEFANMAGVGIILMFAYGTVPAKHQ